MPRTVDLLLGPDLLEAVKGWRHDLSDVRRFSAHSIRAMEADLFKFASFMRDHLGSDCLGLAEMDGLDVRDYRAWLAAMAGSLGEAYGRKAKSRSGVGGLSGKSRARVLSTIRNFMEFLLREKLVVNLVHRSLVSPKKGKTLPKSLPVENADELISSVRLIYAADSAPWLAVRDYALLALLWGSGLRISEALGLTLGQARGRDVIKVLGKGRKERLVPVLPAVVRAIEDYVEACPHAFSATDFLFRGEKGRVLNASVVRANMQKLRETLGLPSSASPHSLRHSFATHLLEAGANIREIQELLGHASLSSTQVYAEVGKIAMIETFSKAHPRALG